MHVYEFPIFLSSAGISQQPRGTQMLTKNESSEIYQSAAAGVHTTLLTLVPSSSIPISSMV